MSIDERIRKELEDETGAVDQPGADDRVFWGVLAVVAFHAVSMLKLWFFMEMNRNSMIREVKRVEIALMRLDQERTAQQ